MYIFTYITTYRLVRMVRIAKLFKLKSNKEDLETQDVSEPSTVGKILTELTTRRLIILVLTMIIVLPLIDGSLDEDYDEFQELGLSNLHRYRQDLNVSMDWIQVCIYIQFDSIIFTCIQIYSHRPA